MFHDRPDMEAEVKPPRKVKKRRFDMSGDAPAPDAGPTPTPTPAAQAPPEPTPAPAPAPATEVPAPLPMAPPATHMPEIALPTVPPMGHPSMMMGFPMAHMHHHHHHHHHHQHQQQQHHEQPPEVFDVKVEDSGAPVELPPAEPVPMPVMPMPAPTPPVAIPPPAPVVELTEEEKANVTEWTQYYDALRYYMMRYSAYHASLRVQEDMEEAVARQVAQAAVSTATKLVALETANKERFLQMKEEWRAQGQSGAAAREDRMEED